MLDLHSHIIYGVDDGSRSLEESASLVLEDYKQGARGIIATPHYSIERPVAGETVMERLEELKAELESRQPGLTDELSLFPGHEVLYFDSMISHLRDGRILTLAGSDEVLIEFHTNDGYQRILDAVRSLIRSGYQPVIAHAERFPALHRHGLSELIEAGAYIQLSTAAFTEKALLSFLDSELNFIKKALRKRQAHFLGSDMHRLDRRPPQIAHAIHWVRKHLPESYAEELLSGSALELQ